MTTTPATAPDFQAIKGRQQQTWASGDYAAVGTRILIVAEQLCDAADLWAGSRVVDVATGSGNAALAAARCGCEVTGVDYVPALLERGRARAAAEGLEVTFVEGDAEALPLADGFADAVVSVVGVMFAPDQERAAAELVRVCRPGGTIALASWTPDGFVGGLLKTVGAHVPPPAGLEPPVLWGTEARLRELLGDDVSSLETRERTYVFRYPSAVALVDFFRTNYGPTLKAFAALDDAGGERFHADLVSLVRAHDRLDGGPVAVPATYLEAVAIRR